MPPRAPSSRAAGKSPSVRAKPPSTSAARPISSRAPTSRRGASTATAAPANVDFTILENGDINMNGTATNGSTSNGYGHAMNGTMDVDDDDKKPRKKGRTGELAKEAKVTRRTSVRGATVINPVPGIPPIAKPHQMLFIFGAADMGQAGQGTHSEECLEIPRPRVQAWLEHARLRGELSRNGAGGGLEFAEAGGMHTMAVDEGGRVWSWGVNDSGCLGRKTQGIPGVDKDLLEFSPGRIRKLEDEGFRTVSVSAGNSISVALSDEGAMRAWGSFRANEGEIGFGKEVMDDNDSNDITMGNGRNENCNDTKPEKENKIQIFPVPLPTFERGRIKIVQTSCGSDHVLALTDTGHVWVWGNGQQNQLGKKVMSRYRKAADTLEPERLGLRSIVHVNAGEYHSFAVDSKGTVWAWGLNSMHQTGISAERGGNGELIITPTPIDALDPSRHDGAKVIQCSGGEHHSVFLFDNGEVYACGRSESYQVGLGRDHPAYQGVLDRGTEQEQVRSKSAQMANNAVTKARNKGLDQGDDEDKDEFKRLEEAASHADAMVVAPPDEWIPEPIRIVFPPIPEAYEDVPDFPDYEDSKPDDNPMVHISAGTRNNLSVSRSGHVYSWGRGETCQLGIGQAEEAQVPTLVRSKWLKKYNALKCSAGGQHSIVLAQLKEGLEADDIDPPKDPKEEDA